MNIFQNFTLDTGMTEMVLANEKRVTISVDTAYRDGVGWGEGYPNNAMNFENTVYSAFERAGYVVEHKDSDFSCPHLKSNDRGNHLDLYLHPQAFTGYASDEDVEKIIGILENECANCVKNPHLHYSEPVYAMTDRQYEFVLMQNAKGIVGCIQQAMDKGIKDFYDIGMEFAEKCRIPRLNDGSGISSSDVDVRTVRSIYEVAKALDVIGTYKDKMQSYGKSDVKENKVSDKNITKE